MFLMIQNLAGRSSRTGLTLRATGLYFFLAEMNTFSGADLVGIASDKGKEKVKGFEDERIEHELLRVVVGLKLLSAVARAGA